MNNFNMNDSRNRRNLLNWSGFFPFHSVTNYSSNSSKIKIDMKNSFGDALYINNLHLIPDPLKKNLADSIITEVKTTANMASETHSESKLKENNSADYHTDSYLPLGFITSFISGVFSFVSGGMFHKRTNSPTQYYECYEKNFDESVPSLQAWHSAKPEDQNKNGWAHNFIHSTNESSKTTDELNINTNSKSALLCDDNLNQVCLLFSNDSPTQYQSRQQSGQQNMFIDSNSIEDCFEDAFTSEDFESLPDDDSCLELYKSFSHVKPELLVSDAPRIRSEYVSLSEHIEIVNSLSDITNKESNVSVSDKDDLDKNVYSKANIVVSSCEDKMNKLKALLQKCQKDKTNADNYTTNIVEKPLKQKELKTEPIFIPNTIDLNATVENIFKEYTIKKAISPTELYSEDIKDINKDLQTSLTDSQCSNTTSEYLSPCNYFDEVTGRFYSTSADSEDSFQIVFDDSPKSCRGRISSECESEDSFIIFDDTPDSCYSSNEVFGDELNITGYDFIESSDSESSDDSDSDSDSESDSGCDTYNFTCKLSHSLTRTIGDLTDDSLYNMDKDEVDCAARFVEEKPVEVISDLINVDNTSETKTKPRGLLLDDKRKLEKKKQPSKTVRFSSNPPKVHVMRVWAFAARQARAGHWERHALDRERFKRRIADVDMAVSWVLKPQHRARVMFQRFMPWWNAQRRMELAEKKQREEEKSAEVEEISPDLPEVTKSDSSVDNTNVGNNNQNQDIYKNQENADISKKSRQCDVKTENLTSNGKILLDNSKTNGLKHGFQNNNVGVST